MSRAAPTAPAQGGDQGADPWAEVQARAARKMAIVDALKPEHRKLVHEIGLDAFSRKYPGTYGRAKARARIAGPNKKTQTDRTAKRLGADRPRPAEETY